MPLVTVVGENCQKEHFLWLFTFTFITKLWYIQVDIFTTLEFLVTLLFIASYMWIVTFPFPLCIVTFPFNTVYCHFPISHVYYHFPISHCVLSLSHFPLCIVTFPFPAVYCHMLNISFCLASEAWSPSCISNEAINQ